MRMRLLGVIGGLGWPATAEYYRRLNEGVEARLGGLHSARVLVHSLDFAEVTAAEERGDWDAMAEILVDSARSLERAGARTARDLAIGEAVGEASDRRLEGLETLRRALDTDEGDILAFLPGVREIRGVQGLLAGSGIGLDAPPPPCFARPPAPQLCKSPLRCVKALSASGSPSLTREKGQKHLFTSIALFSALPSASILTP